MKKIISLLFFILIPSIEAITLKEAISSDIRSEKNILRDPYRNPYETINFFGIKANMKVLELLSRQWLVHRNFISIFVR